ncbi:MAG: hypothetical protein M3342_11725 [Bacteroidota bacterium]|nr:hypothetical protein [Bacteroidota bacterium]
MEKHSFFIVSIILFFFTAATCHRVNSDTNNKGSVSFKCFKGRLEIKGICSNYVIKLLEGDASALNITKTWKDEESGKTYENVFGLSNPCGFPDLKEGAEFYFIIENNPNRDCMVCQAYRPTPPAKNNITAQTEPCR